MSETLRILLLEDVASDAELVEIELRQAGLQFTALRVEAEPEFRQALTDFQPDLILADYALPSFNALAALRIVNQESPSIPFILVTGSQSEEIATRVMKEGAEDYILKTSLIRLPSAVRNALERKAAHQAKLLAEKALRENEDRLQRAIDATQDGIWEWDIEGNQQYCSPRWCEILGYSSDDPECPHTHDAWASRIHPDDHDRVIEAQRSHLEHGSKYDVDYRHRHKSGDYRWQNSRGQAILDEQGKPVKMVGSISDITERKQSEEKLQKSEQTARRTAEQLRIVNRIGLKIATGLDFKQLMQTIYQECKQIGDTDTFYVALYDDATKMLSFPFFYKDGEHRTIASRNIKESAGLAGHIIGSGQTLHLPDESNLPAGLAPVRQPGIPTQSFIGVPLVMNDRIVGVLSMQSHSLNAYSPDQIRTLELAATEVAIAIQNSQLYEQVQQELVERKRAEEELQISQKRLEMALIGGGLGTYEHNLQTREIQVDARYVAMLGYAPGELDLTNMKQWEQLVHPEDLVQTQSPHTEVEYRMRHKDGHWIWVLDTGRVVEQDSLGRPLRMSGVHQDISERKHAEEALRREQIMLARTESIAQIGSWAWDIAMDTVTWSDELFRIFQRDPRAGAPSFAEHPAFYHPDDIARLQQAVEVAVALGTPYELELRAIRKDGETRVCMARGVAEMALGGPAVRLFGSLQDITERKLLEQSMEKARADFLFAVSHELKTPLLVLGTTQEMIESLPKRQQLAQFRNYSHVWRRNLMRLRFIIENLVDSQRPAEMGLKLEKRPTNLMDLVREIAAELEPVASGRSVQFRFQEGVPPSALMDINAFRRLLENLLINAIKFSRPGGQVEIRWRIDGEMVCLDIADSGMGIDPKVKLFLFQPFYRTPEAIKAGIQGTGLGLYVSKLITEAHGGTIQLESKPGKGTTITIRLPLEGKPRDPILDLTPGS